jgi:hypothetical protein
MAVPGACARRSPTAHAHKFAFSLFGSMKNNEFIVPINEKQ